MPAVFVHQAQELRLVQNTHSAPEMLYGKALDCAKKHPMQKLASRRKCLSLKGGGSFYCRHGHNYGHNFEIACLFRKRTLNC